MGKSRTLVYQLGHVYKLKNDYWQVIATKTYKKPNGLFGERVKFENVHNAKIIEKEQKYR